MSVKLQNALKLSTNPKSEEECCACWYPLDSHIDYPANSPDTPEILVAMSLAEPLIDELNDEYDPTNTTDINSVGVRESMAPVSTHSDNNSGRVNGEGAADEESTVGGEEVLDGD
eukprot:CAMPEP_0114367852 /NCGR_PEP_ID=MMETSP0101-20121206/30379_1 /TAXON_ID=38822 ORGANISM="Pteridomonas danica, Strain PT" /NCGR_SAMPLE_ID=MMETSP0101 /ASSEMBLY_ACC=CAM_ASM_000211 /LENGTH=114 /DNA_ID=CAMNT_0001517705 /DNA_START=19 /DNA_END=360 /DNA_ORIENTATION=-